MRLLTLALAAGMMMQGSTPSLCNPKDESVDCVSTDKTYGAPRCPEGLEPYEGKCISPTMTRKPPHWLPDGTKWCDESETKICAGTPFGAVTKESYSRRPEVSEAVQERVDNIKTIECDPTKGNGHACTVKPVLRYSCKDGDSVLFESVNGKRHICVRF